MDFEQQRKRLNVGSDEPIEIEKLYGPIVFCNLRVTADSKTGKWIIEREFIKQDEKGNDFSYWDLACEFDGQESISFRED